MIDACFIETYDAHNFNTIMRALGQLGTPQSRDIMARIERYSYFDAGELEKPELERKITVPWKSSELAYIAGALIRSTTPKARKADRNWFSERVKSFAGQHGDPDWYVRFILRPLNR